MSVHLSVSCFASPPVSRVTLRLACFSLTQMTEIKANPEDDERKASFFRQHSDQVALSFFTLFTSTEQPTLGHTFSSLPFCISMAADFH